MHRGYFAGRLRKILLNDDGNLSFIYAFLIIHMGLSTAVFFLTAYGGNPGFRPKNIESNLYIGGSICLIVYYVMYFGIFGIDKFKWLFINAGLGILGIITQLDWVLSLFGRSVEDYPLKLHVIPFFLYIAWISLIRQAVIDLTDVRFNEEGRSVIERVFVAVFSGICLITYFLKI